MVFNYNFSEHDNVDFFVNFLKSLSTRLHKIPQSCFINEVCLANPELSGVPSAREVSFLLQPPGEHGEDDGAEHILVYPAE